jgi:hypothetical protein
MARLEIDPELDQKFTDAMTARVGRDYAAALRLLEEIVGDARASQSVLGASYTQIGFIRGTYLHQDEAAVRYFRLGVAASPRHELASLGLYHALRKTCDWVGAFEEAERFLLLRRSADYRALFTEHYADHLPTDARAVFARVRRLLWKS